MIKFWKFSAGLTIREEGKEMKLEYQGQHRTLPPRRRALLKCLLENAPEPVPHQDLYIAVYGQEEYNKLHSKKVDEEKISKGIKLDIQQGALKTLKSTLVKELGMPGELVRSLIKLDKGRKGYSLEKPEEGDVCNATFGVAEGTPPISDEDQFSEMMEDIPRAVAFWNRVQEENDPNEIVPYLDLFKKQPRLNAKDDLVLIFRLYNTLERADDAECRAIALPMGDTIKATGEIIYYEQDGLHPYYDYDENDDRVPYRWPVYASSHATTPLFWAKEKSGLLNGLIVRPTATLGFPFGDRFLSGVESELGVLNLGEERDEDKWRIISPIPVVTAAVKAAFGIDSRTKTSFQGFIIRNIRNILVPRPKLLSP